MKNLEEFKQHVVSYYPQEACGVVVDGIFTPLPNIHPEPSNNFMLSEEDTFALLGKKYCVLHSHTMERFQEDPRTPSYEDMLGQQNTNVPWGIVHCDGQDVSEVLWLENGTIPELLGRSYISNVQDCFTLARDYYRLHYNKDLGTHPRPPEWQEWNPHYIEQMYEQVGFITVPTAQVGDILLFSISSRQINHIGVYLGNDTFIHHLHNRKSCEDSVSRWRNHLVKIVRLGNAL